MEQEGVWNYTFKVRSFDVNKNNDISLVSISEYLQEVAGDHANSKGFGYKQVIKAGMVWILGGIRIEVNRLPIWEEEIHIKTWVVENNRFVSRRDFEWYDTDGNTIIKATTNWILFDTNKRRPQIIDQMNFPAILLKGKYATENNLASIKENKEDSISTNYTVRYSDLDMVGHMNNTKYIQLFTDSYSAEFHNSHKVKSIDINFKAEAKYRDVLELKTSNTGDNEYVHILNRTSDNKPNCLSKIIWE